MRGKDSYSLVLGYHISACTQTSFTQRMTSLSTLLLQLETQETSLVAVSQSSIFPNPIWSHTIHQQAL